MPSTQKPDVIQQWELGALLNAYNLAYMTELGFIRRIEAGATVEPGELAFEPFFDSSSEALRETRLPFGFIAGIFGEVYPSPRVISGSSGAAA